MNVYRVYLKSISLSASVKLRWQIVVPAILTKLESKLEFRFIIPLC